MKKTVIAILLAVFLISGNVRPADALTLDPLQLATKVTDYIQKVKESVDKVTQQINQAKMMLTQGFTLEGLKALASQYINADILKQALRDRMEKLVQNAKEKQLKEEQDQMAWNKETKMMMYNDKLDVANEDKNILEDSLREVQSASNQKQQECNRLKNEMSSETDPNKATEKNVAYEKCKTELEELKNNEIEQKALIEQYKENIQAIKEKVQEVKSGDEEQKAMEEKANATKNAEDGKDKEENNGLQKDDEWDNEKSMSKFTLKEEDYQNFMNKYFYDPTSIKGSGSKGMIEYQSTMDRVLRERRFLLVNTAVHLLQVATSVRREIPVHAHSLEAYANQTSASKDELEAMSAYAATRVESAKALLLYARVLSAKLQYVAARDLLTENLSKELTDPVTGQPKKYLDFDLGKYILTPELIQYRLQQANPEQDLIDSVDVDKN